MRAAAADYLTTDNQGRITHFILWNEAANPVRALQLPPLGAPLSGVDQRCVQVYFDLR